jgi:polysaccharide biosynthesis protein PslG
MRALTPILVPLLLLAAAAPASATPAGFYGMNWDRELSRGGTGHVTPQFRQMRKVGVEAVRTVFRWSEMQPQANGPIYFVETDVLVETAVRNRLTPLPVVMTTPGWAQKYPGRPGSPPAQPGQFTRFLTQLAARYGQHGAFWLEHPELEPHPVRHWQIWNEPELTTYWNEPKFWIGYAKLVRASHRALATADPAARLVLAGSVGFSWESLDRLYREGIKGRFDVAAIHPYTGSPDEVAEIVRRNRRVLRRWGEPKKPLWITELSWPATKGRMKPPSGLRRVVTDDRGMAKRLTAAFRYLARPRDPRHRVGRVYWYTWASRYRGHDDVFDYAGLLRNASGELTRKPAWRAFRNVARG